MRRREYIAGGLGLAAVAAGGAYVAFGGDGSPGQISPVEVDLLEVAGSPSGRMTIPAPDTPTVIDLFSYTCTRCPPQLANLRRAHEAMGDRATFVSLHPRSLVDDVEEAEPVLSFWADHGGPWAVGIDPADHFQEAFGRPEFPFTAVIDPGGQVIWAESGTTEPTRIEEAVTGAMQS
jgi:hypothetical protein